MIKAIILDWNRTLSFDSFELRFFNGLLKRLLKKEFVNLNLWYQIFQLQKLAISISKTHYINIDKINQKMSLLVEKFNDTIKGRLKFEDIYEYTSKYSCNSINLIDKELANLVGYFRSNDQIIVGIISSGYFLNISNILEKNDFRTDFIEANNFQTSKNGNLYYDFRIFNNKDIILMEKAHAMNFKLADVAYIGDDLYDLRCFKIVGYPILSWLAVRDQIPFLNQQSKLFCPRNRDELFNYIADNIKVTAN